MTGPAADGVLPGPEPVAPPAPPEAEQIFGAALPLARRYADLLAGPGLARGLLGPAELPRLWERHLLNCAVVAELLPRRAQLLDLGSGAGLPGVVLAIVRPDLRVTLVEPMARRADFLGECRRELGLDRLVVRRDRAEALTGAGSRVVVARAVAPLDRLAGWALPLLRPGGLLVAMKGSGAQAELARHAAALRRLGGARMRVTTAGHARLTIPTTVVLVHKAPGGPTGADRADRRNGW